LTEPATHQAILEVLENGAAALVTSHVRLDGDGVGSALALVHALRARGVAAAPVFQPPTPPIFDFLPGLEENAATTGDFPEEFNLVVLDCGNYRRVGEVGERLQRRERLINIDHHESNTLFGDLNYVDPSASSCAEMVRRLMDTWQMELTPQIAECLFTGVVSDTGQFSHQGTTSAAFSICAECVEAGVRPHMVIRRLFLLPSPAQVRLRQLAMGTLQFHCGGRAATMRITEQMFRETELGPIDTEGFAEIAISIKGVEASALLKEMPGCDYTKVSMRSREKVDVCEVARLFGGGGHTHAAGCEIDDTLENAESLLVEELCRRLETDSSR